MMAVPANAPIPQVRIIQCDECGRRFRGYREVLCSPCKEEEDRYRYDDSCITGVAPSKEDDIPEFFD